MLLDGTTGVLRWANQHVLIIGMAEDNNLGYIVKRYSAVPALITQLLNNPQIVAGMRKKLQSLPKKQLGLEIKPLIERLVAA